MSDAATTEAIQRIRHAAESGTVVLDLGDLPLIAVPREIAELPELQVLALGTQRPILDRGFVRWEAVIDRPISPIADLSALSGVPRLKCLNVLICPQLTDLSPLAGLTDLTTLHLGGGTSITDIRALAGLTELVTLNLSHTHVADLSPLAGLENLTHLDLNWCTSLADLGPLAHLTELTWLNASLCGLVTDASPLAELTGLRTLWLSWTRVNNVAPLAGLIHLEKLGLGGSGPFAFAPLRPLLPNLLHLGLFHATCTDLPPEVCGEFPEDNAIESVRAYYADLAHGAIADTEAKVFVLGNGRVGKTQLVRRLRGEPFDPAEPSTHGIRVTGLNLEVPDLEMPVRLNVWDFGGQDVYHGSHALFLDGDAVYLVVWHPDFEHGEHEENGFIFRNQPLTYWLDFVRSVATVTTPVLVVQARCDDRTDRRDPPTSLDGLTVKVLEASAKTGRGLATLREQIREAVADRFGGRKPHAIGAGRAAVRARLRQMLEDDTPLPPHERRRTLSRDSFVAMCAEAGGISNPDALLGFLHRTGVVFHRPGLFRDQIILDQQWALDAIYTLLDRAKALPLLRDDGRFTRDLLEWVAWKDYSREDQQTFLGMMEACGICFRARERPGGEPEYVAPDLLPTFSDAHRALLGGRIPADPPGATAEARFPFLHEGILRGLLTGVGRRAGDHAVYWKYGCWFYEQTTDSRVFVLAERSSAAGEVVLKAWGRDPIGLLEPLLRTLAGLSRGRPPTVIRSWDVQRILVDGTGQASVEKLSPTEPPDDGRTAVAISYAHGDDLTDAGRIRGQIVDDLQTRLDAWGYRALRDRDVLRNGDLIREFMLRLGRADRVIVVLSDKYLRSPFCMTELHHVFQYSLGQAGTFAERVIPIVLDDARIDDWRARKSWAEHWEAEYKEMEAAARHLGAKDRTLAVQVRRWHADVGDMLSVVADIVAPRGQAAIRADDFAAVRTMLSHGDGRANE